MGEYMENLTLDLDDEVVPLDQQENEDDIQGELVNFRDAVLFNTDWTVETLYRQIRKGNINLDPQFQRREAWDNIRKSRLIESIICGFPIPNVVLAEDGKNKGKYIVIDGKQRLFSISGFFNDDFELRGLQIRAELNGMRFSDISKILQDEASVIENQSIRTIIIRNWPDESYLYAVFYRLNSGSLPLSSQELRKALHGGILLDYIDDYIYQSASFKAVFGHGLDRRMRDVELVLRFVAFERFYNRYAGDLKKFLDGVVVFYNEKWEYEKSALDSDLAKLDCAFDTALAVFGENLFRKWNGLKFERRINRAVFDTVARYFSDSACSAIFVENKERIVDAFKELCIDEDFKSAIERTTKTPTATNTRYRKFGAVLASIVDKQLDGTNMRLV